MAKKQRLGEILLENGLIDENQLDAALRRQKQWGGRLGKNLIELGYTSEINLLKFLSKQLDFPCVDLSRYKLAQEIYNLISVDLAKKHNVIPLQRKKGKSKTFLFVAMSDPTNFMAVDELRFATGLTINPVIATGSQLESAIEKYYVDSGVQIKPLTEKVPVVKQDEFEIVHEVPIQEQVDSILEKSIEIKNPELRAIFMILNEKGLITKDEYSNKLKQLSTEGK
ncbi:MAG: hypothetical protein IMF07_04020 [Proteobacteria bacterium]|nr:hypothetical protein [Pseudomonadota bacterium]